MNKSIASTSNMNTLLSNLILVSLVGLSTGCYTASVWTDAFSTSWEADQLTGMLVDENDHPVALAVKYTTINRQYAVWVHLWLNSDGSPPEDLRLSPPGELGSQPEGQGERPPSLFTLDNERVNQIASAKLGTQRREVQGPYRVKELYRFPNESKFDAPELVALAYTLDPNSDADTPSDYYFALPMTLRRVAAEKLDATARALLFTPATLSLDLVFGPLIVAPAYALGIAPWPP